MKIEEIRSQSSDQLQVMLSDISQEIFNMKNEKAATHKVEKPHLFRAKRKERARILTILSERKKEGKDEK